MLSAVSDPIGPVTDSHLTPPWVGFRFSRVSVRLDFCVSLMPITRFPQPCSKEISLVLRLAAGLVLLSARLVWAVSGGTLSGTVKDQSGGVVPGAKLTIVNDALKTEFNATSDDMGDYVFPNLAVGQYTLTIDAPGFRTQKKNNLTIDADAAVRFDAVLQLGEKSEEITVVAGDTGLQTNVETVSTQLGEVVSGAQIATQPLNGRSYTDLLAIQPGVTPVTTLTPTSVIMAGVTGTLNPSGDANPGDVSISGQRESANGFMVNSTDVQEHMNGGTSVIPNLDSIAEFRVLTNNFDPEYGNYNGGMINVVTKSGSNAFHGGGFEFLRNTALDAKNYFDATRGVFRQNQFGGTHRRSDQARQVILLQRLSGNADDARHHLAREHRSFRSGTHRKLFGRVEHFDRNCQRTLRRQSADPEARLRGYRG